MTIPASHYAQVIPGVVAAGGNALVLNGLFLTTNTRVPIGTVASFPSSLDVSNYFGPTSDEYAAAVVYFGGFVGCTKYPGAMLFAQYPGSTGSGVSAWLRSGDVGALGIAAIRAITSGTLTLTVDGYDHSIANLDLSGATTFSLAATAIQTALSDPTEATFTATISGTTMTVSAVASGTLAVGQTVTGSGVTSGSIITALGTGTGGTGTYTLSHSSTVGTGETMTATATHPVVTYDSVSGGFIVTSGITGAPSTMAYATGTVAASLLMTSATGATISQGAAATTPAAFMNEIIQTTQNWATFTTLFDPDVSGNTNKLAFAAWNSAQGSRYAYVCWDVDQTPRTSSSATTSLGYLVGTSGNDYDGTCLVSEGTAGESTWHHAAFAMGFAASLDFEATEGRATLAYRNQSGLAASVTTLLAATNLEANGYNYYGGTATANDSFSFTYPGSISGQFNWFDSYINQIWLNNQLQLALLRLLMNVKSIPYNAAGYALVASACQDPLQQAITFGAIRTGVTLSAAQIAMVNSAAGKVIDQALSRQGYYLLIQDALPQVRTVRQTPPCTLWYMDGESIQSITLSSLSVQ